MPARLAAFMLLLAALAAPAPAAAQEGGPPNGITTSAEAVVSAPQDIAQFVFGVTAERPRPSAAQALASRRMARVIAAVRARGVAAADVTTNQITLRRITRRVGRRDRRIVRYQARQSVRATVRDIARAGAVVDAAARAGASDLFGPEFDVSNRDELYQQALRLALRRARAKAQVLAEEAGLTLGRAIRIVEGGLEQFSGDHEGAAGGGSGELAPGSSPTSVRAGRESVPASVIVTYETA